MNESQLEQTSSALFNAWKDVSTIAPLTETNPDLSIAEAYRIQQMLETSRLAAGSKIIGRKIGVTSQAVMDMLGVNQPDYGTLFDDMAFERGATIDTSTLVQPRAEGEIAFVLKRSLQGPGVTAADVLAATEGVMACFEIVDSRIADWKIKIQDTIADNASCGVFVLSDRLVPVENLNLYSCGMVLEKNGQIAGLGAGAATMGSPVNAVVWLANTLGSLGIELKAGEIILSGALSAMLDATAGDFFRMEIGGIGECSVRFN
ncbi:MAG: fumarylacetoacetate hydrolase family protein [Pseudomonadales bacterium]|nr:fumarylacetoacetate hydrolase family protein [Pseudomonadales bacterium]